MLNPAAGHTPDGRLHLLPRVVAAGNVSRVGLAEVVVEGGVPVGVDRRGIVLEPELSWERGVDHAGVEDPRVTYVDRLGLHLMTYVAFGPLGPRIAVAVSRDLLSWQRLGPVLFGHEAQWGSRLQPVPEQGRAVLPRADPGPGRRTVLRDVAPADVACRLARRRRRPRAARRHSTSGRASGSPTSRRSPSRPM